MDNSGTKINILIVGATGKLGVLVTKHCLSQPNLQVNIFVRDPQKNKDLTAQVEAAGGKVFKGDLIQSETIKGTTKGMHTVVMTFDSFDERVSVDGQITMIKDCVENKVERLVPAEFLTNSSKFTREELELSAIFINKVKVREYLKTVPIKILNINIGVYLDWLFQDVVKKEFAYWGDSNTKLQLTTYEDTAKVTAAAVARKDLTGEIVFIGNEASISDVCEIYNKVRGTDLKPKKMGTLEDLKPYYEELEKKEDPYAMMYKSFMLMFDERSLCENNNNAEFPEVKPTSIEQFLKERSDVKVG